MLFQLRSFARHPTWFHFWQLKTCCKAPHDCLRHVAKKCYFQMTSKLISLMSLMSSPSLSTKYFVLLLALFFLLVCTLQQIQQIFWYSLARFEWFLNCYSVHNYAVYIPSLCHHLNFIGRWFASKISPILSWNTLVSRPDIDSSVSVCSFYS